MTTFIFNYKNNTALFFCFFISIFAKAQNDSTLLKQASTDTTKQKLNMDAVYNRPLLNLKKVPLAIGGYFEANTQYVSTDGISDGFSFQMRRMTLFFSSAIAKKIKFIPAEIDGKAVEVSKTFEYAFQIY